ncbi:uncharacterized protein LOC133830545 [Humulus lupulus]|uniref:uncharacterized protein LOC133830545 n=1 Tax=Humulus lupulus TaxID=3486 RepID=UPI002B4016A9|nr:uncharacterized protein LOC133830545 [Humulus lupulus]
MDKDLKRKLELPFFGRKKANNDANAKTKTSKAEFNLGDLPTDPGLRIPILNYNPNIRDQVRSHYMQMDPCQPRHHDFPKKKCGQAFRIFNPDWFDDYNWLEYSIEKYVVFCLWCYLFRPTGGKKPGNQSFVIEGFSNWRKIERLVLMLDMLKDIVNAAAVETTNIIIKGIGDSLFSILVDESRDISTKEKMAIVLRYVDKNGHVIEHFIGIEHVPNTTALSLKVAIDNYFQDMG